LFIDAEPAQIEAAAKCGAPVIEIHTGHFAEFASASAKQAELTRIVKAVETGVNAGLQVNAGHGLDYHNVTEIAAIADIQELNIGHAIVARSIFTGFPEAVSSMKRLMLEARTGGQQAI
jgi:pyridoxine 5-phosphate synthase